jgi:glycosyltransferase involved in cell wall biosynthesis
MACSTPVVASRVGGIPEQVVHDSTGRLFTPGSAEDLGKNILDLLENPQLASAMGLAARDRASSLFSVADSLAQHESLFASILSS